MLRLGFPDIGNDFFGWQFMHIFVNNNKLNKK